MLLVKDTIYKQLESYITQQCGLYFKDYDVKNLKNVVQKRLIACNLEYTEEYYEYLTNPEQKEKEFRELLNLLTIKHTYFFRNEPHFKALKGKILPEIIERKKTSSITKPLIRIWSAGCSTGQEPYSIAMTINDIIDNLQQWYIEILATDVSTNALEGVRKGVYGENSMKLVDEFHKQKYFTRKRCGKALRYEINDSIRKMVKPYYLNLAESNYPQDVDIIFCRNVMIYFSVDTITEIVRKFHDSLSNKGYLFIGCSESLKFITDKFKMTESGDAIFYRKAYESSLNTHNKEIHYDLDNIQLKYDKPSVIDDEKDSKCTATKSPGQKIEEIIDNINEAIQLKNYRKASILVKHAHEIDGNAVEPYYLSAQIHTNQGRFEEAKKQLDTVLDLNEFFAPAYYLMGFINMEEQDLEKAKAEFKKAIFLDNNFTLAHLALATAYKNSDDFPDAVREYRNTIKILSILLPDDVVEHSGGFNAGTLRSICKINLENLKEDLCS